MGGMQQAVLEFDQAVQAPWRPLFSAPPRPERARHLRVVPAPAPPPTSRGTGEVHHGAAEHPPHAAVGTRRDAGTAPRGARPIDPDAGRAPHAGADGRNAPPLRLTRRARRLAAALTLGAGVALGSWLAPLVTGGGDGLQLAGQGSVVVQRGDTLWSIASTVADGQDVRAVVDEIQRINGLDDAALAPGQLLRLP